MKLIHAYIQPHKLNDVSLALHSLCGFSVMEVHGRGRGKESAEDDIPAEKALEYEKHLRIEICCSQQIHAQVVEAIALAAHTGLRGDGLICVTQVEDAIRISTGVRGEDAC